MAHNTELFGLHAMLCLYKIIPNFPYQILSKTERKFYCSTFSSTFFFIFKNIILSLIYYIFQSKNYNQILLKIFSNIILPIVPITFIYEKHTKKTQVLFLFLNSPIRSIYSKLLLCKATFSVPTPIITEVPHGGSRKTTSQ